MKPLLMAETLGQLRHDLRTPLNQILGYTEMLLEDADENCLQEVKPALQEIHAGGRLLMDRIQSMLAGDDDNRFQQLKALESEVRPETERLLRASSALALKLRELEAKEAAADIETVLRALRSLLEVLGQLPTKSDTQPLEIISGTGVPAKPALALGHESAGRLLIVEDDLANQDLLRRRLARHGYSVEVAGDGATALDKISQAPYDLVLLDQMMPGMSGLDLLRLLRGTYTSSELPVIMVTAVDQSEVVVEALDQGANDYVSKPVDMPVVLARIQTQLARSKADRHTKLSDPLTGLSNRLLLTAHLADAIARQLGSVSHELAILLLDLDGFKVVNDSFGHGAGDQLLVEVAQRLKNAVVECNLTSRSTIARIGGDEFVVLLEGLQNLDEPRRLADAILGYLAQPVSLHSLRVTISASIGIALGTNDAIPDHLLRNADLAMYRAKELGKNRWQMFDPSLHERAEHRMAIAVDLRHAVERRELLAVYQPKVKLQTHLIVGFEALLRWRHPERGLMYPGDFISVAEETGLIIPIGEWILGQACRQLKVWQDRFPSSPPLSMNVNLSVKQLSDPNLVTQIQRILSETGIPPETLKLELTESTLMDEIEAAKETLGTIQNMRVGLKLDDFGTGHSSLSYLRTLPFDSLKIDRSFVERLPSDTESRAIVETMINLARALHMNVVAEGIENECQLSELIKLGCETGQGFYFSKPLEAEAAEKLLLARGNLRAREMSIPIDRANALQCEG